MMNVKKSKFLLLLQTMVILLWAKYAQNETISIRSLDEMSMICWNVSEAVDLPEDSQDGDIWGVTQLGKYLRKKPNHLRKMVYFLI